MNAEVEWVRIERTFEASPDKIWALWTDPAQFTQWYGPNGASTEVIEMNVVKGGRRMIRMEMGPPDRRMGMYFTGKYTDVSPHSRLSYTESMCDEDGNIKSPESMGMPPGHPETTEVVIQLSSRGDHTIMQLTHIGVPADSGGAGGWGQAFDKMAKLLD